MFQLENLSYTLTNVNKDFKRVVKQNVKKRVTCVCVCVCVCECVCERECVRVCECLCVSVLAKRNLDSRIYLNSPFSYIHDHAVPVPSKEHLKMKPCRLKEPSGFHLKSQILH